MQRATAEINVGRSASRNGACAGTFVVTLKSVQASLRGSLASPVVPPALTFSMICVSVRVRARKWAVTNLDTPLSALQRVKAAWRSAVLSFLSSTYGFWLASRPNSA